MARVLEIPPSLWLATCLIAFVQGGGATSVAIQGWQTRAHLRAAAAEMTGGDPARGKAVIAQAGCGACHEIPGVARADGTVGPPLDNIATRGFLAGRLANTPSNLVQWIRRPQAIDPGNGMPDPPIDDQQARDAAAYLYTLK